jgi:23S rRNA pseudouridine1911/1915/1917 synthase
MNLTVDKGGLRLDAYIASQTEFSRSHIKKITDEGLVLVNGKPQKGKYTVKEGDVVEFSLPELKPLDVKPVDIPLDIVYQDGDVALINKPQGMTVHAGNGTDDNTLVNALLFALDSLSGINGVIRPGIVHRIDKDTSGLLIVAKNDKAHISLASQIESKTCKRIYLALLHGKVKEDSGVIDTFLDRSSKDRTAYAVSNKGRRAVTDYRVVKRYEGYTLCEFSLRTGRTHQIRVHSKHLGNPVVGDKVYGPKKCPFNLNGQLLHAHSLTFVHPSTNEEMTFTCDLPEYFKNTLAKLKEV